jgi:hypothetical protein
MPKLIKKSTVFVKTETAQGTPASPAATDALLVEDLEIDPVFELIQRPFYGSSLDRRTAMIGKTEYRVKFKTEIKNGGTRGTAYAPLGACIQACAFTETATPGTSVVYARTSAPASANYFGPGKSCTIEGYRDGLKHVIAGCMGNMSIKPVSGQIGYFEFEFMGIYAAPTDTDPGTATFVATLPPRCISAAFSVHSLSAVIENLTIETGNIIATRPSMNAATGILGYMITGWDSKGSVDPEMVSVATHDFFGKIAASTEGALAASVGSAEGNTVAIACPKVQYVGLKYAERNGIMVGQLELQINRSTGDDSLTLTFT